MDYQRATRRKASYCRPELKEMRHVWGRTSRRVGGGESGDPEGENVTRPSYEKIRKRCDSLVKHPFSKGGAQKKKGPLTNESCATSHD